MIIGSHAAKHWFSDFPREPADIDCITSSPLPDTWLGKRVENFWDPSFPVEWNTPGLIANPSLLYTFKVSHSFWELHGTWAKHMSDILFFQRKGVEFNREVYDILLPVWKEKHGKKRTSLAQTKADFFNDAVKRIYDHDSIHDSVAYEDVPMYTRILQDGEEVAVDNAKFWDMSEADKFKTVREEIYATALERWVIPSNYRCSPRAAYAKALQRTVTSLFKGEWALYLVLNYQHLYAPDHDYVAHHRSRSDRLILL